MNLRNIPRSVVAAVSQTLAAGNKEAARALPDSKGGETPKQLQTYRTSIYTYFTRANGVTELLYSAENWVRIKLTLETAGPVAIGTDASIGPVLSGHGRLLDTDEEYETYLPKGNRIYVISESINRVAVTIEPVPWLEQISTQQESVGANIQNAVAMGARAMTAAIAELRGVFTQRSPSGLEADQLPVPRGGSVPRALLTPGARIRKMQP